MSITPARDEHGRFIKSSTGITYSTTPITKKDADEQVSTYNISKQRTDPPLLFLKISNPITYIKRWWKRLVGNEGLEFRLRIKPLTALMIAAALGIFGFGVGRVTFPSESPIVKYIPQLLPIPTINPWKNTAFSGTIHSANNNYYLVTSNAQAIQLSVPSNIDLSKYIGKRILMQGLYNENQWLLKVISVEDIELLNPKPQKIPTLIPSPTPSNPSIDIITPTPSTDYFLTPSRDNPSL